MDATCASAVTHGITSGRDGYELIIPTRVDSLTEDTDLVTISIGGNDIGFRTLPAASGKQLLQVENQIAQRKFPTAPSFSGQPRKCSDTPIAASKIGRLGQMFSTLGTCR